MKISVVIPLYNKINSFKSTVQSVLSQTYENFELIIVNDGSTDRSETILETLNDDRIKLINIKNSGVAVARNKGIELASSNYVCLLDADDLWLPEHLCNINLLISKYPECSLYSSCFCEILETGDKFLGKNSYPHNYLGIVNDFYIEYSRSRSLINSSSVCLNKKMFNKIGGFPAGIKLGEDIYVWLRMAMLGKMAYSNSPQVIIRRDAENRTVNRVSNDILYHVTHFTEKKYHKSDFNFYQLNSLNHFLIKNIFVNALFSLSIDDKITFTKYLKAMKTLSTYNYYLLQLLGKFSNPRALKFLKKIRNNIQSM